MIDIKKYIRNLAIFGATAVAMTACSDDNLYDGDGSEGERDIVINLSVPDFTTENVASRAVDENGLSSVVVLGYNAGGQCVSYKNYSSAEVTTSSGVTQLRASLPKGVVRIELAANASSLVTSAPSSALSAVWNTASLSSASNLVFWGKADIASLLDNDYVVSMLRQSAKVAAFNQATATFTLSGMKVVNSASRGSVAPTLDASGNPQLTVYGSDPCNVASDYVAAGSPVYIYETAASKAFMIIKGTYKGATNYYKVGFFNAGGNTQMSLLRNHYYKLNIKEVIGEGYSTEAEAIAGDFSNRIVVEIKDHNEGIYNIIGGNDYALGVCDDMEAEAEASTAVAEIILIAATADLFETPAITIDSSCASWITGYSLSAAENVNSGTYTSPGRAYKVTLNLNKNNQSSASRTGGFTVKFRDLKRTVKIVQKGKDFKRDRKVIFKITNRAAGAVVTSDYFDWVDNTLNGVKKEQMMGVERNEGLHFSTETDVVNYLYQIPYLTGDQLVSTGDPSISVVRNGSYWDVKLTTTTAAEKMWVSKIIIKNASGIQIEYPVYRTGILHEITSSVANTYQVPNERHYGWFYYETVAVTGTDGKTYYMLDRNLGATGNGPFSLASASLSHNSNTVGGYYKIANSEKDVTNIKPYICPEGFTIPSSGELEKLGFSVNIFSTYYGEQFYSANKTTDATKSLVSTVYVPTGGYVEGNNYKNSNHANLWTSTYLSGPQGFSKTSPEYKYWFMYFDAYTSKVGFSNIRFVNGGSGQMGSVFKGMPVRCVRGDRSENNSDSDGSSSGGTTPVEEITIYWNNSLTLWATPRVYTFDSAGHEYCGAWHGKEMTYVSGSTWKATIRKDQKVIFNDGNSSQYPASGGWDGVADRCYCAAGNMGTWSSTSSQRLFWDNSASTSWSTPYVYYWKSSNTSDNAGWPGKAMTKTGDNIWKYDVPSGYDRVLFHNNGGTQTVDLKLQGDVIYNWNNQNSHKP